MGAALKIALRELSGGLKGFGIYIACITLGVAAIAAAGSVTQVFTRGLDHEARTLLGGDVMLSVNQRLADSDERAFAEGLGTVTEKVSANVMGGFGETRKQVDLTAVDDAFPLVGSAKFSGGASTIQDVIARKDGVWGTAVSVSYLEQFDAKIGDVIELGPMRAEIRAQLDGFPDQLGTPGSFGPEALLSLEALRDAGRLTNGQLFRSRLIVSFDEGMTAAKAKAAFEAQFPGTSLRLREPENAIDGLQNLLGILKNFLSIIGIAALIAGGIGVEQATSSFLQARTDAIAALKSLGADSSIIRTAYLIQLGVLALFGGLIGVVIGAAAPYLMIAFAGDKIALPQAMGIYPFELLTALILGLLAAGCFAIPAVGRARATPPSALFRSLSEERKTKTPWLEQSASAILAVLLVALALITSTHPLITMALLAGAAISWGVFLLAAAGIKRIARQLAQSATGLWRLALSNIGGPGSLASTIVPSLGLGLALLTLVVSVQTNLLRQISETAPSNAPSLVFSQIPSDQIAAFDKIIADDGIDISDEDQFRRAPFLLVRVTELKGEPVSMDNVAESEQWVVRGETQVTYLGPRPSDAVLTEGEWWTDDYTGPLLVSVEADAARGLRLSIGDTIGIRVFGRELTATVASLRKVEWGTFGIGSNTAFIFSPGTLEAANPYHVAIARTDGTEDKTIIAALGKSLPGVLVFETQPALEAASKIFADISIAVNAAASVVTISGLLVLFGTFAAMTRKRARESALLKTFGAERRQILGLYAVEFALAGGAGALLGAIIGIGASWPIVVQVFEAKWRFPLIPALIIMGAAILVSAIGGLVVGRSTLQQSAARVLRSA